MVAQIATSDGNVDGAIFLRTIKASGSDKVWGHYIEITIDFENNEYQAISNTINGIIGVNNTGTTD